MPGALLTMSSAGAPEGGQGHWHAGDPSGDHRRAEETEFPLTLLCEGQAATVLQLPAQPATAAEADAQKRVTYVADI